MVTLQPHGDHPPFFCLPGISGSVIHLYNLARQVGTRRPFLGLRCDPNAPLTATLPQIAARYTEAILAHQPAGPYYLGGYSFGAMVAYEVARQLLEQGHEIGLLAIIDQCRPGRQLNLGRVLAALPHILGAIPQRLRDELAEVPLGDRLRHLKRLGLRWSKTAFGYRAPAASVFNLSAAEPEIIERYDANLRALYAYQPGRLRASLTLFRAETQLLSHLALDSTLGWSDLTEGNVTVCIVPGNHYTITTEPLLLQLADAQSAKHHAVLGASRSQQQKVPSLQPKR